MARPTKKAKKDGDKRRSRTPRTSKPRSRTPRSSTPRSQERLRTARTKKRPSPHTLIQKASGELEPFSRYKFRRSLRRSGAAPAEIRRALDRVEAKLHPGIHSRDVFRIARDSLARERRPVAAQYSLKKAVISLGPTGFPFEHLVAAIFRARGYKTNTGVMIRGRCVSHEIDVVATRRTERILVECKFHNSGSFKSDVKVALYVSARARDIREKPRGRGYSQFWLVTNTRFTSDASRVAGGNDLHAVSWEHPKKGNLHDLISEHALHPITCLTSLPVGRKKVLLERGIVLCREFHDDSSAWQALGLNPTTERAVREELEGLEHLDDVKA